MKCASDDLERLHRLLVSNFEFTDKYRKYDPHITIAYVKKEEGWKYYGNRTFFERSFTTEHMVFSSISGEKYEIPLHNQ